MASMTAKILLISAMPTASGTGGASGGLANVGRRAVGGGQGRRETCGAIEHRELRDRDLLIRHALIVVPGDGHDPSHLRDELLLLGHPALTGRRRHRRRRRASQRLLADLIERRRR